MAKSAPFSGKILCSHTAPLSTSTVVLPHTAFWSRNKVRCDLKKRIRKWRGWSSKRNTFCVWKVVFVKSNAPSHTGRWIWSHKIASYFTLWFGFHGLSRSISQVMFKRAVQCRLCLTCYRCYRWESAACEPGSGVYILARTGGGGGSCGRNWWEMVDSCPLLQRMTSLPRGGGGVSFL